MTDEANETLIAENDRQTCKQLAAGEPPYSQRATALLALDAGATPEEAASQSGMNLNQVKYWRGRFRASGLAIFPEGLVIEAASAPAQVEEEPVVAPEEAKSKKKKSKKKGKKNKGKKGKNKKKSGKGKKGSKKKGKA